MDWKRYVTETGQREKKKPQRSMTGQVKEEFPEPLIETMTHSLLFKIKPNSFTMEFKFD